MNLLTGDLGKTETYSRREYRAIVGLGWPDGRQATVWFEHWTAKRRRGTRSKLSRYAVSEVRQIGFAGRAFVWDKERGEDEHGEPRPNARKPPYTVRIDQYGEIWCECMAGACKAPTCRHADMQLLLLDEGVFDQSEVCGC